jgi:hypothetical protein
LQLAIARASRADFSPGKVLMISSSYTSKNRRMETPLWRGRNILLNSSFLDAMQHAGNLIDLYFYQVSVPAKKYTSAPIVLILERIKKTFWQTIYPTILQKGKFHAPLFRRNDLRSQHVLTRRKS